MAYREGSEQIRGVVLGHLCCCMSLSSLFFRPICHIADRLHGVDFPSCINERSPDLFERDFPSHITPAHLSPSYHCRLYTTTPFLPVRQRMVQVVSRLANHRHRMHRNKYFLSPSSPRQPRSVPHRTASACTVNKRDHGIAKLQSKIRQYFLATATHLPIYVYQDRPVLERTAIFLSGPCQACRFGMVQ